MATLLTIRQFAESQPGITESTIRQAIFYRGNDLERAGAVQRMGRRILVSEEKFLEFVATGGLRQIRGTKGAA